MKTLIILIFCFTSLPYYSQTIDLDTIKNDFEVDESKRVYIYGEWYYLSNSASGSKFYIRNISNPESDVYDFWIKIVSEKEYSVEHWKIYCGSNTYSIMSYIYYDLKGLPKTSKKNLKEIEEIIPDTMTELIYRFICEAKFRSV